MIARSFRVAIPVIVFGAILALVATGLTRRAGTSSAPTAVAAPPAPLIQHGGGLYGVPPPELASLTPAQKLDRAHVGVVHGQTGQPTAKNLNNIIVSDFPLSILGVKGPAGSYQPSSSITLRVPGGTLGSISGHVEDGPIVRANEEIYVTVRDQGTQLGGGNTNAVLLATQTHDVFEVKNGLVMGAGLLSGLAEPKAVFETHFGP